MTSLRRISRAIDLHSRHLSGTLKLTGPQLTCLLHLHRNPGATPSTLAQGVALSQATISGILDRLERQGFIARTRSKTDRRRYNIALTDTGVKAAEKCPSPLQDLFAKRFGALPAAEQDRIERTLSQVAVLMEPEGESA